MMLRNERLMIKHKNDSSFSVGSGGVVWFFSYF